MKDFLEKEYLVDAIFALSTYPANIDGPAKIWHLPATLLRQAGASSHGTIALHFLLKPKSIGDCNTPPVPV